MPDQTKTKKRQNRFRRMVFSAMTILGGLNLLSFAVAWFVGNVFGGVGLPVSEAATIGVIGGADGPTAVFITSSTGATWQFLLWVVLTAIGIYGLFRARNK